MKPNVIYFINIICFCIFSVFLDAGKLNQEEIINHLEHLKILTFNSHFNEEVKKYLNFSDSEKNNFISGITIKHQELEEIYQEFQKEHKENTEGFKQYFRNLMEDLQTYFFTIDVSLKKMEEERFQFLAHFKKVTIPGDIIDYSPHEYNWESFANIYIPVKKHYERLIELSKSFLRTPKSLRNKYSYD